MAAIPYEGALIGLGAGPSRAQSKARSAIWVAMIGVAAQSRSWSLGIVAQRTAIAAQSSARRWALAVVGRLIAASPQLRAALLCLRGNLLAGAATAAALGHAGVTGRETRPVFYPAGGLASLMLDTSPLHGADVPVSLPALWLLWPLPQSFICPQLAGVRVSADGDDWQWSPDTGVVRVAGLELLDAGGVRTSWATIERARAYIARLRAALVTEVGESAVMTGAARAGWVAAMRRSQVDQAQRMLDRATRKLPPMQRAALMADFQFALSKW